MRRSVGRVLLAAVCFTMAPAAATTARAADDTAMRDAKARFEEGLKRAKAGDYEAARLAFVQAHAILNRVDILWNLALVEEKAGRPLDALSHFKEYVRDTRVNAAERAQAEKHAQAMAAQTGHIEVTAPSGATILIDGSTNAGTAPLIEPLDVAPGKHRLEARTTERQYAMDVTATPGDVVKVSFTAQFAAPMPAATTPSPSTNASPAIGAAAPSTATPLGDGASDSASSGERAGPASSSSIFTTKNIVVGSLGVGALAAIGVGVGFAFAASSDDDKVTQLKTANPSCGAPTPGCSELASAADARTSDRNLRTGFLIGGVVLAAGAFVAWKFWPTSDASSPSSPSNSSNATKSGAFLVPTFDSHGAGIGAVGRF